MTKTWRYTQFMLALWLYMPLVRRLYEWKFGFSDLQPLVVLPLAALLPYAWHMLKRERRLCLPRSMVFIFWLWFGVFTYGLVLSVFNGHFISGLYTYMLFILPILPAIWIASNPPGTEKGYPKVLSFLFINTTIISIYGIVQWILVPPWDGFWLKNAAAFDSAFTFGNAIPFQIRVFATLNSPLTFSLFIAFILLLALPEFSLSRPKLLFQTFVWIVALGLSLERTAWLIFAIGIILYLVFSRRIRVLISLVVFAAISIIMANTLASDTSFMQLMSNRLQTFTDLDHDISYRARRELYATVLEHVPESPFGQGLGIVGQGTKLDANVVAIDSGILARLVEMGFAGTGIWLFTLATMLVMTLRIAKRADLNPSLQRAAFAFAGLQIAFLLAESSADMHLGLNGLLLWMNFGLLSASSTKLEPRSNTASIRTTVLSHGTY